MGPTWGPSGADGTRWAPCWPNELCYLGYHFDAIFVTGCTGNCGCDNVRCSQWRQCVVKIIPVPVIIWWCVIYVSSAGTIRTTLSSLRWTLYVYFWRAVNGNDLYFPVIKNDHVLFTKVRDGCLMGLIHGYLFNFQVIIYIHKFSIRHLYNNFQ